MERKLVLCGCMLALAFAGCGTADREHDAAAVAERFHTALAEGDGRAACEELTRNRLEAGATREEALRGGCRDA